MSRESGCSDDVTDITFTDRNLEPAQPLAEETAGPAFQHGGGQVDRVLVVWVVQGLRFPQFRILKRQM